VNPTDQTRSTLQIAERFEAFDRNLRIDDTVEVRWTNSHRYFSARGEISKLNSQSLKVKLLEAVPGIDGDTTHGRPSPLAGAGYPVGYRITVPRTYAPRWSANNGVFPLPPLQGIVIDERGAHVERPLRCDAAIRVVLGMMSAEPIGQHEFYISSHTCLLAGTQFVALQDGRWPEKQLPIHDSVIPLRGPLFIVRRALVVGGYWQSLSSTDIAAFARLFGIDVRDGVAS
jgi:hypothetical protein